MLKTAFIGAGNMGGSIISALCKSPSFCADDIFVCDKALRKEISDLGIKEASLCEATKGADVIILAVKPNVIFDVIENIRKCDIDGKTFVSVAAGIKLESLCDALGTNKIVRVMPNICLMAGEGMSVLARANGIDDNEMDFVQSIFDCAGKTSVVSESLIDACTAINGSGPAYVFMFIEALADAAVNQGIDRQTAYALSTQTVLGSAKMVQSTNMHPAALKDMVCSPGGTTIEAVKALENANLRSAVMAAVEACVKKARELANSDLKTQK